MSVRRPFLPRMEIAINRASPKVVETKLKKNQTIVVVFDVNVQGPSDCAAIFDDASIDTIGEKDSENFLLHSLR